MMSQANIDSRTPMGATLLNGGASFRVWAPRALQVYVNGLFGGTRLEGMSSDLLLARDANGYWTGFLSGAGDGDVYRFLVIGEGSPGLKRDPYAREMADDAPHPNCSCVLRSASQYPWHDSAFVTPDYSNMIVYQLHVGTYAPPASGLCSTFLDVIGKIEYLAALGINVLQPLPVDELETNFSMGYNGTDYFSPDCPYIVPAARVGDYLELINRLLTAKGLAPLQQDQIASGPNQLKAMVDLCHVYGVAVVFDVVYNHAGGFFGDDQSLYFWDRARTGNNNDSLYFTDKGWAGGLSFALWNNDVREFILNNARFYLEELHADGFRYDEISVLLQLNGGSGWSFCRDLTNTVRFLRPRTLQNAEHWPVNSSVVAPAAGGGLGFDVLQHDGLRDAVRGAIAQSAQGRSAHVDLDTIAEKLHPAGFSQDWQAVTCIENHDIVKAGEQPRIPRLADPSNARSWYVRSRSRVANAILMTAPGIPQIFMGQEFLEDKQWHWDPNSAELIWWDGLSSDKAMIDHLRFMQELIRLRWRQPALRSGSTRAILVHNDDRVLAYHRWLPGSGRDAIIVASLAEDNRFGYSVGFPWPGRWLEVFNSDVYDNWVNPLLAGNGGAIEATGGPMHRFGFSAAITLPANSVLVFARDPGD